MYTHTYIYLLDTVICISFRQTALSKQLNVSLK